MLHDNYQSPWLNDELRMLQDAARKFFEQEFAPRNEAWIAQGKVDRDELEAEADVVYQAVAGEPLSDGYRIRDSLKATASG